MKIRPITATDFYKVGHRTQYPDGTELVVSNFTCRGDKYAQVLPGFDHKVVFFGLQGICQWLLINLWNKEFFQQPKEEVLTHYKRRMDTSLGPDVVGTDHIAALHDLGYLPILIKALPEGSRVGMRVPLWTIRNTLPEFFWVTNYLETQLSAEQWKVITSATTAYEYRRLLDQYAVETGAPKEFVPWQGHDFSFRGLSGIYDAAQSGAGHLLSFTGTDTIAAIDYLEDYYDGTKTFVGGSVPACYDDKTDILTAGGFKLFSEITDSDLVAQYHEDGAIDFVKPSEIYKCQYSGEMIHFKKEGHRYIDICVTPNHRMIRRKRQSGKTDSFEAGTTDYHLRAGYSSKHWMIVSGKARGILDKLTPLEQLRIAFQADGSFPSRSEKYTGARTGMLPIRFSLKKERKAIRLVAILDAIGCEYTKEKYENGYYSFWIKLPEPMTKDFSWVDLSKISHAWAQEFIEELKHWDGYAPRPNLVSYASTNYGCIQMAQAVGCLAGYKTHLSSYIDPRGDRAENFDVTFTKNKTAVTGEDTTKTTIAYDGIVYCVSVPTRMLVVRRSGVIAISGNTEHSVMCLGGENNELETFERLITKVYPKDIVSIVSDSWDFWRVITEYAAQLKPEIMVREGKTVFRPDSGSPVKIVCGDPEAPDGSPQFKGAIECLWDIFGGTTTAKGFRTVDSHVGLIYGDSINLDRATRILAGLKAKGFSSANIIFGIGSFTYQAVTRDNFGTAIKATFGKVNGEERAIYKNPKTDDGLKKSANGLLRVEKIGDDFVLFDKQTWEQEEQGALETVFKDGKMHRFETLETIRKRLHP